MRDRVLSAAILAPIAVALVIAGGTPFMVGIIVMCGAAVWEGTDLLAAVGGVAEDTTWRIIAVACSALLLGAVGVGMSHPHAAEAAGAALLVVSLIALLATGPPAKRFLTWSLGVAALVYLVGLGAHFMLLRGSALGLYWTLLACAVTWSTDIGAFFAGRSLGVHPFFPAISPNKTLEGAAGGLAAGIVAAVVVAKSANLHVSFPVALALGLTVSAAAQAGDLVESFLKREAGAKDSGTLIPGHGGVLDRIDSLLFAVTIAYYWRLVLV